MRLSTCKASKFTLFCHRFLGCICYLFLAAGLILSSEVVSTNGQGHGALVGFLVQHQVNVVLCGGIGAGAQAALAQAGIQPFGGISGSADAAAADYLAGRLVFDPNAHCNHHAHEAEHACGSHSCHEDKGGCAGSCH